MDSDREHRIREIAYSLWEQAGQPAEGADQFWYQAERQLQEEGSNAPGLSEEPVPFATNEMPLGSDQAESLEASEAAKARRRSGRPSSK